MTSIVLICVLSAALGGAIGFALWERAAAKRAADETERMADALGTSSELAASLDLDEVARRTVDAVAVLPGVDAVLLEAPNPAGGRTRAVRGLSDEEAERVAVQTTANSNLRAMDVAYRYRLDDVDQTAGFLRAGLVVPLVSEGRQIGALAAFTRSHSTEFPEETAAALERFGLARRRGHRQRASFRRGPAPRRRRRPDGAACGADAPTRPGPSDRGAGCSPREAPACCCSPEPSPSSLRRTSRRPCIPPPRWSASSPGAPDTPHPRRQLAEAAPMGRSARALGGVPTRPQLPRSARSDLRLFSA